MFQPSYHVLSPHSSNIPTNHNLPIIGLTHNINQWEPLLARPCIPPAIPRILSPPSQLCAVCVCALFYRQIPMKAVRMMFLCAEQETMQCRQSEICPLFYLVFLLWHISHFVDSSLALDLLLWISDQTIILAINKLFIKFSMWFTHHLKNGHFSTWKDTFGDKICDGQMWVK